MEKFTKLFILFATVFLVVFVAAGALVGASDTVLAASLVVAGTGPFDIFIVYRKWC